MSKALDRGQRSGSDPIIIGDANNTILISKGSDNLVKFQTQASGQSAVSSSAGATKVYADISAMTASSSVTGDQAFVTANSGLYIYNGGGWYKVATVNTSPTISSPSNDANITLATNGTATSIELVGADVDEGTTLQNSYAVTTGSLTNGGGATATITSSATSGGTYSAIAAGATTTNRFFKITPTTTSGYAGTFSLTFSMSDGINAATTIQNFTLAFINTTGGSSYLASGNGIIDPGNDSDFTLGTTFTIETWAKCVTNDAYSTIFAFNSGVYVYFSRTSSASMQINNFASRGGGTVNGTADSFPLNTWVHIAFVANSGAGTLYINGTSDTTYNSVNIIDDECWMGGQGTASTWPFHGYLSDTRVVKGTAVYTGNFSAPNGRLTKTGGDYPSTTNVNTSIPAANTVLLTNTSSTGSITDASDSGHTLTITGFAANSDKPY